MVLSLSGQPCYISNSSFLGIIKGRPESETKARLASMSQDTFLGFLQMNPDVRIKECIHGERRSRVPGLAHCPHHLNNLELRVAGDPREGSVGPESMELPTVPINVLGKHEALSALDLMR